jgi:hypothetical protein
VNPALSTQLNIYKPWLFIAGVFLIFVLLRWVRKGLRSRIDRIGTYYSRDNGYLLWFWFNAPGVVLHEISHAIVILLFYPFRFRITSITFFHVKPKVQTSPNGRVMHSGGRMSLQLGEVQYARPQGRLMSHIGDGLSGIAPLFGGILAFLLLYWVATGYPLWNAWHDTGLQDILRPGWPWWTLLFAPYLVLTITSELWPSHQDWRGARNLVIGLGVLAVVTVVVLWLTHVLVFNHALLLRVAAVATDINFALLVLLGLEVVFFIIADLMARLLCH